MVEDLGHDWVDDMAFADCVVFGDGPQPWQGWSRGKPTGSINFSACRDMHDVAVYVEAQRYGVPCFGWGRGGLLLMRLGGVPVVKAIGVKSSVLGIRPVDVDNFYGVTAIMKSDMVVDTAKLEDAGVPVIATYYGVEGVLMPDLQSFAVLFDPWRNTTSQKFMMKYVEEFVESYGGSD